MQYITTDSYGQLIGTIPNLQADDVLLGYINEFFSNWEMDPGEDRACMNFQKKYIAMMEEAVKKVLTSEGKIDKFSDIPDHYNRPMGRYIIKDEKRCWNYILDVFATLDIRLEISCPKRFFLTHIPFRWTKLNEREFVPKIQYQFRLWNTPVSHYLVNVYEAPLSIQYSSRVERARQLIGLPKIYDPKEPNCYERVDYDIRRAIFNEVTGVLQSGFTRASFQTS